MAKKKLARFAEMERLENVFQPRHEEIFRTDHPLKGKWGKEIFHNDHPIVLEIGCGKGEYTVGLGKLYPEKNFIGIDIKGARMWHGAKTALEQNISNSNEQDKCARLAVVKIVQNIIKDGMSLLGIKCPTKM